MFRLLFFCDHLCCVRLMAIAGERLGSLLLMLLSMIDVTVIDAVDDWCDCHWRCRWLMWLSLMLSMFSVFRVGQFSLLMTNVGFDDRYGSCWFALCRRLMLYGRWAYYGRDNAVNVDVAVWWSMITKLAVLLALVCHMYVFSGEVQLAYAGGFGWKHSLGERHKAVRAKISEVSILVVAVFDACIFTLSLLFLIVELRPWWTICSLCQYAPPWNGGGYEQWVWFRRIEVRSRSLEHYSMSL